MSDGHNTFISSISMLSAELNELRDENIALRAQLTEAEKKIKGMREDKNVLSGIIIQHFLDTINYAEEQFPGFWEAFKAENPQKIKELREHFFPKERNNG